MYINLTNVSKDYIPSGEKKTRKQHTAETLVHQKCALIQNDCNFFQGDANGI